MARYIIETTHKSGATGKYHVKAASRTEARDLIPGRITRITIATNKTWRGNCGNISGAEKVGAR